MEQIATPLTLIDDVGILTMCQLLLLLFFYVAGPPGNPEIWWASISEGSVEGGDELGLIGKKFQSGEFFKVLLLVPFFIKFSVIFLCSVCCRIVN